LECQLNSHSLEQVVDWLRQNPVDVPCLQETKVVDVDFRDRFARLSPYISGQKSYNGVVPIGSKQLQDVSTGFAPILGVEV